MCSAPDIPDPIAPVRYSQQRQPTRADTGDAQTRALKQRKRATSTLLAQASPTDTTGGRTLLGA